jgi:PBP1b-binding outer membrane lipoprotein LpoB
MKNLFLIIVAIVIFTGCSSSAKSPDHSSADRQMSLSDKAMKEL